MNLVPDRASRHLDLIEVDGRTFVLYNYQVNVAALVLCMYVYCKVYCLIITDGVKMYPFI